MWKLCFLLFTIQSCCALRILVVFPLPGGSHTILAEGYVRHLLDAGHEITYITAIPRLKPSPNLRHIDVSTNFKSFHFDALLNLEKLMNKEVDLSDLSGVKDLMVKVAESTLANPNVKKLLEDPAERFDVVVAEWMYTEIYSGFSAVFGCPLVWSSSMEPHSLVLRLIDEWPNPAYVPDHMYSENPPYNYWQRVKNLWLTIQRMLLVWSMKENESRIYNEGFGPSAAKKGVHLPPLEEAKYNGSIMLGNSHVSLGQPTRLPQNYVPILGYHIPSKLDPLPENLQKIMDNAAHGVIYFSMGSMLKSATFPSELKKGLLNLFSGMKQTVIWKFEEAIPDLPKNVRIVQWAPQQSILAHPNCVLFITHGGLLSLTEAVHFAVPVIGVPMFADQFLNMDRVVKKGFAKKVHLDWDFVANIKIAIGELLDNPRYRETVKEVSFIYHHRPASPGAELVHWVEHVAKTGGATHLRSPALHVPCYQKLYLDLIAVVLVIVVTLSAIFKLIFRSVKTQKQKKN